MSQEMAGHWVGPCDVDEFFNLTMPLNLKEGEAEVLPHIDKKHFSGKKPRSENAVALSFVGPASYEELTEADMLPPAGCFLHEKQRQVSFSWVEGSG